MFFVDKDFINCLFQSGRIFHQAESRVALGIQKQLGVPVRYVGVGEGVDDLLDFDRDAFLAGLLGEDAA